MSDSRRILLVEDDPNDIFLIERACKRAGLNWNLIVAADGEEASRILTENGDLPEILLLDLKLPRKSGLELLSWIREQPSPLKRLPVVMLTSSNQTVDINLAYDLGANSYLVKPVKFELLLELVKKLDEYWFNVNERPHLMNLK